MAALVLPPRLELEHPLVHTPSFRDAAEHYQALMSYADPWRAAATVLHAHHVSTEDTLALRALDVRPNGTAKISAARMADRSVRHAFGRIQTTAAGLNLSQARMLKRIADGETVFHRNIGNQEKLTLGALKNMGCIELDEDAQYRPTDDLRLALPNI